MSLHEWKRQFTDAVPQAIRATEQISLGMTAVGRKCEYKLMGVNVRSCGF